MINGRNLKLLSDPSRTSLLVPIIIEIARCIICKSVAIR